MITTATTVRKIYVIAAEIKKTWKNVYFGAVPYLEAMESLSDITSVYGMDSAKYIITYFLSNAATFKGEDAKRIKKELKDIAGIK